MQASEVGRGTAAATAIATALGLAVDRTIVVNNSNRIALRLLPCDVLARVAFGGAAGAQFEVELANRLAETKSPVAALDPRVDPRVHERNGFSVTFWTYHEPLAEEIPPVEYARALERLHAGMRGLHIEAPHFTERIAEAQQLVASRGRTPALREDDRTMLSRTLDSQASRIADRRPAEQLLHGEPHPGNFLNTSSGPLFIDLETACRGPIEFDLAHVPEAVSDHYPGLHHEVLRDCRILALAMIAAWRWDREDQFPNGRHRGAEWTRRLRAALQTTRVGTDRR